MSKNNYGITDLENETTEWLTVREAVKIANRLTNNKIKASDIYRHALHGNIFLSIYFQSPVILRRIKTFDYKIKLRPIDDSTINRLCLLERNCFLSGRHLIISTKGEYFSPIKRIIDTTLSGYEYVLVQRLLARSLSIPLPVTGANGINYGISVSLSGEIFQVFEKVAWSVRIKDQMMRLPNKFASYISEYIHLPRTKRYRQKGYFPLHDLPPDACFVIRRAELERLVNMLIENKKQLSPSTRISTP
ncbi:hypothetical protein ACULN0_04315 [Pectobacterium actinidiae]|uniref:hypothetical protein n=1 Tax=Pectobacterium actinidiae TaxID=1507808 RepID=UPI0040408313